MTVIAFDGKTLATDRQINYGDAKVQGSKSRRLKDGTVVAWCGNYDAGTIIAKWYEDGANKDSFPFNLTDDALSDLVVITPKGECLSFCQSWIPVVHKPPMAFGSGNQAAMAAMIMGADAVKAVVVASLVSNSCGMGTDKYTIKETKHGKVHIKNQKKKTR